MALVFELKWAAAVVIAAFPKDVAFAVEPAVGEDFDAEPELEEVEILELKDEVRGDDWDADCELGKGDVDADEDVVLDGAAEGLKFTPVKTICNSISVGWPVNVVSTVVDWSENPQLYCEYPPGYKFL
jgi:hypothetical protein